MKYPLLKPMQSMKTVIDQFGGYNRNARIGENEFHDMKHICGDKYPVLSTSPELGTASGVENMPVIESTDMLVLDTLFYESLGGWFPKEKEFMDAYGSNVNYKLKSDDGTENTSVVSIGTHLVSFPAKKYASIYDKDDYGSLDFKLSCNTAAFYPCDSNYENIYVSTNTQKPGDPTDGAYWTETTDEGKVLWRYDSASSSWVIAPVSYTALMIADENDGDNYDREELYNGEGGSIYIYIRNKDGTDATIDDEQLKDIVSTKEEKRAIIIRGYRKNPSFPFAKDIILEAVTFNQVLYWAENYDIVVERKSPQMDYVVECNNRLWGCRYGTDENGKQINEIYASKLGDFKNWWVYQGVSTDSYAVTVGRSGKFTGACVYKGRPIFFKEDCMIVIYGDYPAQYQVQYLDCSGVMDGSHKSIAIVGDALFYHTRSGICVYNGSIPQVISGAFGDERYHDAIGCGFEEKYYVALKDKNNTTYLFYFDTNKGIWYKALDNKEILSMCEYKGELYLCDDTRTMRTLNNTEIKNNNGGEWLLESGNLGANLDERKYISKVSLRVKTDPSAKINVYVQYDGDGVWRFVQTIASRNLSAVTFHLPIRRCDHFKIKMVGTGYCEIHSITKYIRQGSLKK